MQTLESAGEIFKLMTVIVRDPSSQILRFPPRKNCALSIHKTTLQEHPSSRFLTLDDFKRPRGNPLHKSVPEVLSGMFQTLTARFHTPQAHLDSSPESCLPHPEFAVLLRAYVIALRSKGSQRLLPASALAMERTSPSRSSDTHWAHQPCVRQRIQGSGQVPAGGAAGGHCAPPGCPPGPPILSRASRSPSPRTKESSQLGSEGQLPPQAASASRLVLESDEGHRQSTLLLQTAAAVSPDKHSTATSRAHTPLYSASGWPEVQGKDPRGAARRTPEGPRLGWLARRLVAEPRCRRAG